MKKKPEPRIRSFHVPESMRHDLGLYLAVNLDRGISPSKVFIRILAAHLYANGYLKG